MVVRFFREGLFQLIVGIAVTGTIATIALVTKVWNWPNAVVGGVLLLCGTMYVMERLGVGPSIKSRVRDWLDSSGYSIQTVQDIYAFHFVMTDNVGFRTDVFQVKSESPITIMSAKHTATQQQVAVFNSLARPEQFRFWQRVRIELLRYGVQFSNLTLEGEGVNFSDDFVIGRASTGTEFLRRVLFVRSGARLYQELLLELHNPNEPPSPMPASVTPQTPLPTPQSVG
jgi:hypothetical protein